MECGRDEVITAVIPGGSLSGASRKISSFSDIICGVVFNKCVLFFDIGVWESLWLVFFYVEE